MLFPSEVYSNLGIIDSSLSHFIKNMASTGGGAIHLEQIALNVSNCSFVGNKATLWGGAIQTINGDRMTVKQSKFGHNKVKEGGALHVHGSLLIDDDNAINYCTTSILESSFSRNTADFKGGAIFIEFEILNTILSNIFTRLVMKLQ